VWLWAIDVDLGYIYCLQLILGVPNVRTKHNLGSKGEQQELKQHKTGPRPLEKLPDGGWFVYLVS